MDKEKIILEEYDAQLMDIEEGKLAMERGTTQEVKEYGEKMVKDHTEMLKDTRELAEKEGISLPPILSKEKAEGLMELKEKHGEDFDKKFIKMMIIDHKRDVRCLKRAVKNDDLLVQQYGQKYLPMLQNHLEEIRQIRKSNGHSPF